MRYFLISKNDAITLGVDGYRRETAEGVIVTEADLLVSEDIAARATEVDAARARVLINKSV